MYTDNVIALEDTIVEISYEGVFLKKKKWFIFHKHLTI